MIGSLKDMLFSSALFDDKSFYRRFPKDLKRAKKQIVIDSPFITEKRIEYYLPIFAKLIKRKVKIRVNTRNPACHSFSVRAEAEGAINSLVETGVAVYIYDDWRHWKLAVIDNKILWEGSLNILSHAYGREIMRRSVSRHLCHKMIDFARIYY